MNLTPVFHSTARQLRAHVRSAHFLNAAVLALLVSLWLAPSAPAGPVLGGPAGSRHLVLVDPEATEPERHAARELATTLSEMTHAQFVVETLADQCPRQAIFVGRGPNLERQFAGTRFNDLGEEEILIRTQGRHLLLSGGRPRGSLYAVSRFLQDNCGVRWWTPWARLVPERSRLSLPDLNVRAKPAFEARDPFWFVAFDKEWAVRNFSNSQSARIPESMGGHLAYKGFVHTFYPLVPPEQHFAAHPEWFSQIKGQRSTNHAQLCLANPALSDFVTERVRQWLRESPQARIVSISQNDWHGACECDGCRKIDEEEGSPAGILLRFVNQIAQRLEAEYPQVAFDTLAYQYTRKPPRITRPRPNVIVRLCSIECDFREPLEHPSNAAFADDIRGWSRICDRLYVWDYTTDFAHYVQPHPNWFVLGPNLRFFHQYHVRGMFEQGAYQSHGSEMAEMRAWVLAQLLWNPFQDDQALINEFLRGYYGPAAAGFLRQYLDLMHVASQGFKLGCFAPTDAPHTRFRYLAQVEDLWQRALTATAGSPELQQRVRTGHLATRYAWLRRWDSLRQECDTAHARWPLPESKSQAAEEWLQAAKGDPQYPWSRVTLVNESGVTPELFIAKITGK